MPFIVIKSQDVIKLKCYIRMYLQNKINSHTSTIIHTVKQTLSVEDNKYGYEGVKTTNK